MALLNGLRGRCSRVSPTLGCEFRRNSPTRGFTLVEMLVAMAITLVMMAAVVTLFANVSSSVSKNRSTMEMNGQVRQVRNVLQQDLQGATCPGLTWQRPESNHGYIELIEGQYREGNASNLIDGTNDTATFNPEIDHALSILPSSNLPFKDATGTLQPTWATDGGGLGDYDDILMLTVRNEQKPFVGRSPSNVRLGSGTQAEPFDVDDGTQAWSSENIESPLAEVVWFAIENPETASNAKNFFGEPGMRTVYRRTLLIAPWVNPYRNVNSQSPDSFTSGGTFKAEPGLVRLLPNSIALEQAIAAIIAFQDRYDLSVRLEWDPNISRWKIMANTLGDLTKRENRFGHYGFLLGSGSSNPPKRVYPFPLVSIGSGYGGSADVEFEVDPEVPNPGSKAKAEANIVGGAVISYSIDAPMNYDDTQRQYDVRPFAYVDDTPTGVPATAQAVLNEDGAVVRVLHGPVPLWGSRRGEDVMLTDVLAFDVRAFDPGAPIFATRKLPYDSQKGLELDVVLTPSDPGWRDAFKHDDNMAANGSGNIGRNNSAVSSVTYPYVGQGAYVDLGYGYGLLTNSSLFAPAFSSSATPWFFTARALSDVYMSSRPPAQEVFSQLAPGFSVYDTWSFHYENDGVNEDALRHDGSSWQTVDTTVDEGTNGLDDLGNYSDGTFTRLGVDDVGERETVPPYDKPLRGVQVLLRSYERDSRAIRQVRVNQHFMPE
jgi:prepilin-type N-terminal cleavage/methylation domain-containing protein